MKWELPTKFRPFLST